jgi:signal transduction histidine kinase
VAWWQYVLAALTALPLATRRRYPLTSFWVIAIAIAAVFRLPGVELTWTLIAAVLAAYSAPAYSRYRNLALVSVFGAAILVIANPGGELPNLPSGVVTFLLLTSVALGANVIHAWRQRAQTLQREQAAATRLALEQERARLARELHDVVGHNVSVMVVQAGAARKVLDTAPDQAREALLAVEAGGRAAMTELRQVIGLLAPDVDDADLAPQPGLAQLPVLADRIRETGVPVTLTVTGTVDGLPAGVDLAAYRVVQEALTNTVKHAAGAAVTIAVRRTPDELRVEVTDTGGLAVAAGTSGGRGLTGLRDRLATYGGTLTTSRRPTGGFRVVAVTPLPGDP